MTYNEKKSLYESIMKEVAKTVKQKINESDLSLDDYLNSVFEQISYILKTKIKDFRRNYYYEILNTLTGDAFGHRIKLEDISDRRLKLISEIFVKLMANNGTEEEMVDFIKNMTYTTKYSGKEGDKIRFGSIYGSN